MADQRLVELLADELGLPAESVARTVALLDEGATAPFLARYRREHTGGLGEHQVHAIARRRRKHRALARRKAKALGELERLGVLSPALKERVEGCPSRAELEDVCLAHRPRRRTRAALARERGLEPLADMLVHPPPDAPDSPTDMALPYTNPERGVPDVQTALAGAAHILAERAAEHPDARGRLRHLLEQAGVVRAAVVEDKSGEHSKYEMYYEFAEPVRSIPAHRILAIHRGQREGWLAVRIELDRDQALAALREACPLPKGVTAGIVEAALADAWDRLLAPSLEAQVRARLKQRADGEAIAVFARNLRGLLLQPPAGARRTLGVVPGYRTGCKLAAVDERGKLLEACIVFPHEPEAKAEEARTTVADLIERHGIEAIAIANGTASRETDLFFREVARELVRMLVSDAGAKVYGGSRAARDEFPQLDAASRAAVSTARRFQDPLAELVQVDPKAIGVGQYQHDVNQQALREALEAEVQSCVNLVGADPSRATAAHLARVAGLDRATAHEIVRHREEHGPVRSRAELMALPGMDARRFLQAAGFLRIADADQPLDATAIHPERYDLVARMAADAGTDVRGLLGNREQIERIDFGQYAADGTGEPTLRLIRRELLYPGRDPRGAFRCVEFRADVAAVEDIKPGMILEGTVTNVTNFGAFVDIGVHEDGLVHVSELAHHFVKDPNEAARVGDIVKVKVIAVDAERRRISLSIKQASVPPQRKPRRKKPAERQRASRKGETREPRKPKRDPKAPATREDIERLIAHFMGSDPR